MNHLWVIQILFCIPDKKLVLMFSTPHYKKILSQLTSSNSYRFILKFYHVTCFVDIPFDFTLNSVAPELVPNQRLSYEKAPDHLE